MHAKKDRALVFCVSDQARDSLIRAFLAVLVVATLGIAAWLWWPRDLSDIPSDTAVPSVPTKSPPKARDESILGPEPPDNSVAANNVPGVADTNLVAACGGSLWSALFEDDQACLAALDHAFLDQNVTARRLFSHHLDWVHPPPEPGAPAADAPTWRHAFADPLKARQEAAAALARRDCLAGDAAADDCAADAIAQIALLQDACVWPLVEHGKRGARGPYPPADKPVDPWWVPKTAEIDADWQLYIDDVDADPDLTLETYWRKRTEIDEAKASFAWRLARCASLPDQVLAWFDEFPAPDGRPGNRHQARHLYAVAARLGVEWTKDRAPTF